MHYPSDILVGLTFGALAGLVAYLVYYLIFRQVSAKQNYISSQYTSTGYSRADVDVVATALVASYVLAIIWSLIQQ
jgi:undecaprenyl-diphosphatase